VRGEHSRRHSTSSSTWHFEINLHGAGLRAWMKMTERKTSAAPISADRIEIKISTITDIKQLVL